MLGKERGAGTANASRADAGGCPVVVCGRESFAFMSGWCRRGRPEMVVWIEDGAVGGERMERM